ARNVATGKLVPLNVREDTAVRFHLTDERGRRDEVELRCEVRAARGYQSHFETCPNADEARKPKKK
ncbi:MAG: hypothetical protein KAJ18_12330, partial [Candidatus Omnitrophica bacterium]|nr:hypothetical protein [Candidatus Omnitrophota bacterium]